MNNTILFHTNDIDKSKLKYVVLPTKDETILIESYMKLHDSFHTLRESFYMTDFNFFQITNNFIIHQDDRLTRTTCQPFNDFSVINALVANYLSISKIFIDLVEKFNSPYNGSMKEFISDVYDKNFSYCLMSILRNFTLHGHLPVYLNKNQYLERYSFNLDYILTEGRNFKFSKSGKSNIENLASKIHKQYKCISNISFSRTIIEYHKLIYDIYIKFFELNYISMCEIQEEFELFLNKYRSNVHNKLIIININNDLHGLIISDYNIKGFEKEHKRIKLELSKYINKFKDILPSL